MYVLCSQVSVVKFFNRWRQTALVETWKSYTINIINVKLLTKTIREPFFMTDHESMQCNVQGCWWGR